MLKTKMASYILMFCLLLVMHANTGVEAGYGILYKKIVYEAFYKCCMDSNCMRPKSCVRLKTGPELCRCYEQPPTVK